MNARTQTEVDSPALLLLLLLLLGLPFDCLAYTVCHGAARAMGREAAGRRIDRMDMIIRGRGTVCEGVDEVCIP